MILNKLCELEDWLDPFLVEGMRRVEPELFAAYPGYPAGYEHRKSWEYGQLMSGLESLGVLRPDAMVLAVAAGHERPLYALTNRVRWVFAIDIYGFGNFTAAEAEASMLHNPDRFAPCPYNRNRLVVEYMDARDLRFEADTFDAVFCLSSIEHFGGEAGARTALLEIQRVMKPGAVLMLTTECIVNGEPPVSIPHLELFTPESIVAILSSLPQLQLLEEIRFTISPRTLEHVIPLGQAVQDGLEGRAQYPHIVLELAGRWFTSLSAFLRKCS